MAKVNQMVVKLKLASEMSQEADEVLRGIQGVDEVEQIAPQRLRVTYDVTHTGWATLRERLQAIGAYSQTGMLARWRDGWREFLEQNMRDNLNHKPACCSKAPVGGGLGARSSRDH